MLFHISSLPRVIQVADYKLVFQSCLHVEENISITWSWNCKCEKDREGFCKQVNKSFCEKGGLVLEDALSISSVF